MRTVPVGDFKMGMPNRELRPLNKRERLFVRHYVDYAKSALAAASAAGYAGNVDRQAYELLRRPAVVEEIKRRQALLEAKGDMDSLGLFNWSVFGATADYSEIYEDGTWTTKPMSEWDPRIRRLVESVKVTPTEHGNVIEVKFSPRAAQLDRVKKMLGFRDNLGVEVKIGNRAVSIAQLEKLTAELGPIDEISKLRKAAISERRPQEITLKEIVEAEVKLGFVPTGDYSDR